MVDVIKDADNVFFNKTMQMQLYTTKLQDRMNTIVGENTIKSVVDSLDLTNESNLVVKKVSKNLYSFKREIATNLAFKNIADAKTFLSIPKYEQVLLNCATFENKPTPLNNTLVTDITLKIDESIRDVYFLADPSEMILLSLTIVGIPLTFISLYERYRIRNMIKSGIKMSINGYFKVEL